MYRFGLGLSPRAGHPEASLRTLHGNILDLKCFNECGYVDKHNLDDPPCPALAAASTSSKDGRSPLLDPETPIPAIDPGTDLPRCPDCAAKGRSSLLRPGVVWFREALDAAMLDGVDDWVERGGPSVDVMLVVGTAAAVYPAAGYTDRARARGAVVAVVNPDPESAWGLRDTDFWFEGDAAGLLPRLFEKVTGPK